MSHRLRRLVCWLAPGVMVAMAICQHIVARTAQLSAWSGGGFGMFATVDAPWMRICRVHLKAADGIETRGRIPPWHERQLMQVQVMPTPARVAALAEVLAAETWVPETYDPFGVAKAGAAGRRSDHEDQHALHRALSPGEPPPADGGRKEFSQLRVEFLKSSYDQATGRVTAKPLEEATATMQ